LGLKSDEFLIAKIIRNKGKEDLSELDLEDTEAERALFRKELKDMMNSWEDR